MNKRLRDLVANTYSLGWANKPAMVESRFTLVEQDEHIDEGTKAIVEFVGEWLRDYYGSAERGSEVIQFWYEDMNDPQIRTD